MTTQARIEATQPPAEPMQCIPGVLYFRDPRVMRVRKGDYMMRTFHGWMVGSLEGLAPYAFDGGEG